MGGAALSRLPSFHFPQFKLKCGAMADPFKCFQCEKEESRCQCDKFCTLCQGEYNVRLCQDGMYYCIDCREACDFQAQV